MFEIIFSAVVSSIISLLIKAGLEDKVNPLKKLFSPSQEKQRMKALQRAFQKAKDEFHDPGMGALLENPSFQEFVIACLLDPEQRLNFDDAAHLLGKQFEQHRRSIKRFLNIMEYHLMEDETWSEILERFRTLRSQQEIKSLLEKNGQVSTPTVIRAVVEQLATLSDAVKSLEKDDLSQEISRAVVEKLGIRDQKTLRELYLKQVAWEANKLPWTIISSDYSDEQKARIIQLDEVYTDLDTCEVQQIDREDAYTLMMKNIRERELVPALQMIDRHSRLLVMGNPGSGKSTFVKYVACLLAQAGLNGEPHLQKLAPWSHGALLPVFVELRGFSAWLRNQTSRKSTHQCLTNYLKARLSDDETIAEFWPQFADLLASDKPALIIFDGLDEVPQDHRGAVVDCVNDFAGFYNDNRYIVTCRPYAYIGQPFQLDDFHTATLAPFSEEKIQEYIKKWYHLQEIKGYFKPSDAIDRANRLIAAIRARGLRDLAERPLLLTIMVQIHSTKKRLPQDRTELYADAVNLFLERWEGHVDQENNILDVLNMPGLKMSHLRAAIYEVAFRAHQSAASAEEAADIEEEHLRAWMAPHLDGVIKKAELFVDYIHERAGLLIRHKTDAYQFPHRSFQEFLAACHLLMQEDFI
ncbi:NACHT domain-containing protein, partial [candidate division KSB1 bacterium]